MIHLGTAAAVAPARLDAPPGQVWTLLPEVYGVLGIPAEINDPAAGS
jgi:hypothetical protein